MLSSLTRLTSSFLVILIIISCALNYGPVHTAAKSGDVAALGPLIDDGQDINKIGPHGMTPLIQATYYGYAPTVRELLRLEADPNIQDDQRWTALHYAADSGRADIAQILVDGGANIYLEDKYGKTAHMVAQEYVARGDQPWLFFRIFGAGGGPAPVVTPMPEAPPAEGPTVVPVTEPKKPLQVQ